MSAPSIHVGALMHAGSLWPAHLFTLLGNQFAVDIKE
jgi:hypothetical protein